MVFWCGSGLSLVISFTLCLDRKYINAHLEITRMNLGNGLSLGDSSHQGLMYIYCISSL